MDGIIEWLLGELKLACWSTLFNLMHVIKKLPLKLIELNIICLVSSTLILNNIIFLLLLYACILNNFEI